jgi:O-antigen/teichoic acid export membrane protein
VSRKLHVDVGWLWVGYLGRALVYLGLTVVLTRGLGADDFGQLSLFLAITLGVSQVTGSWPFLAVPVLSAEGRTIGAAFRPAAKVAAATSVVALAVALPISYFVSSRAPISLLALVGYSLALISLQGVYAVLQTEGRMRGIAAIQSLERAAALVIALAVVAVGTLTVLGAEALLAVACLLTTVAAYVWVTRRQPLFRPAPGDHPDHLLRTVMSAVGPMGIASVCAYGVAWVDVFILAAYRSNADVGVYSLAYQVFTFVVQLGSLWAVAALPRHATSAASGEQLAEQLPMPRLRAATAIWSTLIAVVAIGSAVVLPHAFGSEFDDAFPPLMVLLAGSGVFAAGYFLVLPALIGARRTTLIAWVSAVTVLINLGLDLALVPAIGVMGPALATVSQTLFGTVVFTRIALGWRATAELFAIGVPAAASAVVLAFDRGLPYVALAALLALASAALATRLIGWTRITAGGWRAIAAARGR